jgi:phosphate transport system protein
LPRLMDMGLEKITDTLLAMASIAEKSVATSIDAYTGGKNYSEEIREWSDELRTLQEETSELAIDLIARYQPVATDLRYIRACMEISYGFSRLGRYALDIIEVLEMFGDLSGCDHSEVELTAKTTKEMIRMSIDAFAHKDVDLAKRVPDLDDYVDEKYRAHVSRMIVASNPDIKCETSATLILRYLERIADHSSYIGESVVYIVTGENVPRK